MIGDLLNSVLLKPSDIATAMEVSIHTVRSWQLDRRTPNAAMRRRLAKTLRHHAKQVKKVVDKLERSAET